MILFKSFGTKQLVKNLINKIKIQIIKIDLKSKKFKQIYFIKDKI